MHLSFTLAVADLQRTEDFYREVLDLNPQRCRPTENSAPFLLLRCANSCLVFRPAELFEAQHPALLQNLTRQPFGVGVQIELGCSDLTVVRNNIERYQWPVAYELDDAEHQRSEIWVQDPDGYLIVLNEES